MCPYHLQREQHEKNFDRPKILLLDFSYQSGWGIFKRGVNLSMLNWQFYFYFDSLNDECAIVKNPRTQIC